MSLVELSALLNVVHKFANFKNWWRRKIEKKSDTGNIVTTVDKVSGINKQKKRIPVSILPQKFDFVKLNSIFVELWLLDYIRISEGYFVDYELQVRRIEEIEITLIFADPKDWGNIYKRKEFYLTVDTSNESGKLVGRKEVTEERIEENLVAFAYISQIRFKHEQEHWSIEGKKNILCEDTLKSLESLIERK